mmetsp:Transcript_22220/g.61911  ORF Transcript_22220/g.61911 Transcript_22220/m.61911 type:complete len:96 (+) Transcript_22220:1564-1851(+)
MYDRVMVGACEIAVHTLTAILSRGVAGTCWYALAKHEFAPLPVVYRRSLVVPSIGDIILSLSSTVHLFLVPGDRTDSPIAYGNDSTCNALGFAAN